MGACRELWDQFERRFREQDYDGLVSLFTEDAVYVEPAGRHEGRKAIRAWFDETAQPFSDVRFEVTRLVEQGDAIVAEWTYHGVHTGPLTMADGSIFEGTGKTSDSTGVTILDVRDGAVVAATDYFDLLAGAIQLGLMPTP